MNWEIKEEGDAHVVVLAAELSIQHAADFYQAVLPLASGGGAVRVNARQARSVHTSIMQILYALSQASPDFGVTEASDNFRATEIRAGLFFARADETNSAAVAPAVIVSVLSLQR